MLVRLFSGFLAGLWLVLNFGLWNTEQSRHGSRELLERGFAFGWLGLHGFIMAQVSV